MTAEEQAEAPAEEAAAEVTEEASAEEATQDTSWREAIDDDSTRKLADRYTSPAAMAKALREANTELSTRVKMPGDDASAEDLAKFRKAMGVPDDVSGYDIPTPEHLPEDVFKGEDVQGRLADFAETMHKSGASKESVETALKWYWSLEASNQEALIKVDRDTAEAAEADLRREWGADYDGNVNSAESFIKTYGGEDLLQVELKDGTKLGSHPHFVRMAAEAGRRIDEGRLQAGLQGTAAGQDIQKSYDDLSEQIHDAHRRGETDRAGRLDTERAALSKQLFGDRSIAAQ